MTKNSVRLRSEPSADNNISQTNANVNTDTQKNSDGDLYDVISESNRLNVENQELKGMLEYYKSEMHRTKTGEVPNYEAFRKLANRIAKGYTGDTDLKVAISEAWSMAAKSTKYKNNTEERNRLWDRYTEMAQEISWDIAMNTLVKNDENAKMFKDIKSALRNKRIFIPEKYRNELDGGYAEFRKKNFGKFKLADGGVPLDVVYFELNGAFGEIFPSDITDPIEQINCICEVLEDSSIIYENPYSNDLAEAAKCIEDQLTIEILRLGTHLTKADKYYDSAQRMIAHQREAFEKKIKKINRERYNRINQLKWEMAQKSKKRAAEKQETVDRNNLLRLARRVETMLKNGVKQSPAKIDELLENLNTDLENAAKKAEEEARKAKEAEEAEKAEKAKEGNALPDGAESTELATPEQIAETAEKQNSTAEETAKEAEKEEKPEEKKKEPVRLKHLSDLDLAGISIRDETVQKLLNLQDYYEILKTKKNFVPNERIEEDLKRLGKTHIKDMDIDYVHRLTEVLMNFVTEVQNRNYEIGKENEADIYEKGYRTIVDITNAKGMGLSGAGETIADYERGFLSPVKFMHRVTGYNDNDPLYRATLDLQKGELHDMMYHMKANKLFSKFINDKKFMKGLDEFCGFEVTEYGKDGKETGKKNIRLSRGMMISLYLHNKNVANQKHMVDGGVIVPDEKLYKKGSYANAFNAGQKVLFAPGEIAKITQNLTEQERMYANAVHEYFNSFSKERLNEVSRQLTGIDVARVENYFPINCDSNFTKSTFGALGGGEIENSGSFKERQKNANNPIDLRDVTDVVNQYIDIHAKYVAFAIPVKNFERLYNVTLSSADTVTVTERDKYGNEKVDSVTGKPITKDVRQNTYDDSVQSAIARNFGAGAKQYINDFLDDIKGVRSDKSGGAKKFNWIYNNYAFAVLTCSWSIALNQAASIPSAIPEIGCKAILKSLGNLGKVDLELISKYTAAQWNRTQGAYDETVASLKADGKWLPVILDLMTHTDAIMTRKLWKATEYYIRDKRKDLKVGSDEYYRAVAEKYESLMMNTQPNTTVMERPGYLRADSFTRMLLPFMGEPLKNVNIMYDGVMDMLTHRKYYLASKAGTAEEIKLSKEAYKESKKRAVAAIGSQVLGQIVYSVVVSVGKMIGGGIAGWKRYEDEEGKITVASWLKKMGEDALSSFFTQFPFVDAVYNIISAIAKQEVYFGDEIITTQMINEVGETLVKNVPFWKAAFQGKKTWQESVKQAYATAEVFSRLFGIPLKNFVNFGESIAGGVFNVAFMGNSNIGDYMKERFMSAAVAKSENDKGEEKYTPSERVYNILYRAFKTGDVEAYDRIFKDLTDSRVSPSDIEAAMKRKAAKDENFNYDNSLGFYSGMEQEIDYEEYEKYYKTAEKLDITDENLRKGVDIVNSDKPYKEMFADMKDFIKGMDDKQKEFFTKLAQAKYSAEELSDDKYKEFSQNRNAIQQELLSKVRTDGLNNAGKSDVQKKINTYAEAIALRDASNGDYNLDTEWILEAEKSKGSIGCDTAEFIRLYNDYGKSVYSKQNVFATSHGYNVEVYLKYCKAKAKYGIDTEKDEKGNIIKGKSKQDKVINIISNLDVSNEEKAMLFGMEYKSNDHNPWAKYQKANYQKFEADKKKKNKK